jgi:DhnA family fructose-bisphosphate aldolase class Ia
MVIGGTMRRRKQELWEIVKRAGEGCGGGVPSGSNVFQQERLTKMVQASALWVHQEARA